MWMRNGKWTKKTDYGESKDKNIKWPKQPDWYQKPSDINNLFEAIDFNVIGLLLGMMIFAGMLEISGFFEFVAIKATKLSGGDPWKLVFYLGTFTTVISVFIDNVTALILIAPVTLKICSSLLFFL